MLEIAVGDLYPAAELINSILVSRPEKQPAILDLGMSCFDSTLVRV